MKKVIQDSALKELDTIKKLLILGLMKSGATASEISRALGMDKGNFSRAYQTGKVKPFGQK